MPVRMVRYAGDKVLRKKARAVKSVNSKRTRKLIDDMFETMYADGGVGLAAPQVGESVQVIVIDTREDGQRMALINPRVTMRSKSVVEEKEGCLSIPGVEGMVCRSEKVIVRGRSPEGKWAEITGEGLLGRALQHEIDHLNGVLFIDHLSQTEKNELAPALAEIQRLQRKQRVVAGE